jgi:hypothetical protein
MSFKVDVLQINGEKSIMKILTMNSREIAIKELII